MRAPQWLLVVCSGILLCAGSCVKPKDCEDAMCGAEPEGRCPVANQLDFAPQVTLPFGPNPQAVATGDFDHDTHADIAVANYLYVKEGGGPATIRVFYGAGDGTFMAGDPVRIGDATSEMVVTDIDGDQIDDMALPSYGDSTITAIFGDQGRSLRREIFSVGADVGAEEGCNARPVCRPWSLAIADLNNDRSLDLVVLYEDLIGTVDVFLGKGGWAFQPATRYRTMGAGSWDLKMGDIDGDGKPDLVVANEYDSKISTFFGNGDGTYLKPPIITPLCLAGELMCTTGLRPNSLALVDLNGDRRIDVVAANSGDKAFSGTAAILLSGWTKGAGGYRVSMMPTGGGNSRDVTTADFNCDGQIDLAFANYRSNTATVLLGGGADVFSEPAPFKVGTNPAGIAAGDFNGDRLQDLVVANSGNDNVGVLMNASR